MSDPIFEVTQELITCDRRLEYGNSCGQCLRCKSHAFDWLESHAALIKLSGLNINPSELPSGGLFKLISIIAEKEQFLKEQVNNETTNPKILITGNPRSGTTTHQRVLKQCGLDIKHEEMGSQGTVSCYYFVDKRPYPHGHHVKDKKFNKKDFDAIYLLVRDPMKCIPSMRAIISPEHQIWLEDLGFINRFDDETGKRIPKSVTMVKAWLNTNSYILNVLDPVILLSEELELNIQRLVDQNTLNNLERPLDFTWKNASRGIFKAKEIEIEKINNYDPDLLDAVQVQYNSIIPVARQQSEIKNFKLGVIN